jgi:hypothetical protein
VFDPEVRDKVEIEARKAAHVVRKLMRLGELMPHSSSGHLASERLMALKQNDMASETG